MCKDDTNLTEPESKEPCGTCGDRGKWVTKDLNRWEFKKDGCPDCQEPVPNKTQGSKRVDVDGFFKDQALATIRQLEAENTRIVSEGQHCHKVNDELCKEHVELQTQLAAKDKEIEELQTIAEDLKKRIK